MDSSVFPSNIENVLKFPLIEALLGRRSRRFRRVASIPDGPLAFASRHEPYSLNEIEQLMVLAAVAGNIAWHYDRFSKSPGTVPSIFVSNVSTGPSFGSGLLRPHFKPGAYLPTHARHMAWWHPGGGK